MKLGRILPPVTDETLLLLAAGEMSPSEARELEQTLAADPDAVSRLATIRCNLAIADRAFAGSETSVAPATLSTLIGRAAHAISVWQADRTPHASTVPITRNAPPVLRARWGMPTAAAAAVLLLAGGTALMRLLPTEGRNDRAGREPALPPLFSGEEREFHLTAVRRLAMGGEVSDLDTSAPTNGFVENNGSTTADPAPLSAAAPVALALDADTSPYFNVPLAGEDDAD